MGEVTALAVWASLGKMAQQVAHDAGSPLAALDMLVRDIQDCHEDQRILLRASVQRIRDISQTLLDRSSAPAGAVATPVLMFGLTTAVLSEKRLQYRTRPAVTIDFHCAASAKMAFVHVAQSDFKRVLSNLMNNAVEAISHAGRVEVSLEVDAAKVTVRISDNGEGMSAQALAALRAAVVVSTNASTRRNWLYF